MAQTSPLLELQKPTALSACPGQAIEGLSLSVYSQGAFSSHKMLPDLPCFSMAGPYLYPIIQMRKPVPTEGLDYKMGSVSVISDPVVCAPKYCSRALYVTGAQKMSQLVCCPGDLQAWLSVTSASVSPVLLSLTSHLHTSSEEQVQTGWRKVLPSKPMHATQCPYVRFFPPPGTSWGPCLLCSISSPHPATQFPWACPLFCLLSVSSRQHGLVSLGTMCLCPDNNVLSSRAHWP